MMKKNLAVLLGTMMLAGAMTGCGSSDTGATTAVQTTAEAAETTAAEVTTEAAAEETPESVTVDTAYGEVEVPYAPERICVLDLSTMDIMDALGLGDKVVSLQWHKHYPSYLDEYYNSETIISLTSGNNGHGGSADAATDENTDPYEIYYGIDADLIIGTTEKITEELYEILSQIAPTVAFTPALESSEDIYTAMRENAEAAAAIWGMDEEFETKIASYDDLYEELKANVEGKTFALASGNTNLSTFQFGTASTSTKGKGKSNTVNMATFLTQLGMTDVTENVSEDASADALAAAEEAGTSAEDAAAAVISAVNEAAPDSLFIFNYGYSNLEEVREAGFDVLNLDDLACPYGFFSIELTYTSGGMTAVTSAMDLVAETVLH